MFTLIIGLLLSGMLLLRILMAQQMNKVLKDIIENWDSQKESTTNYPNADPILIIQKSTKH